MSKFAIVLGVVAVLTLVWIGGEQHYQSCVAKVTARTQPWTFSAPAAKRNANGTVSRPDAGGWSTVNLNRAQAELDQCSRF